VPDAHSQDCHRRRFDELAYERDAPPVKNVSDLSGHKRQKQHREELEEPDKAKIRQIARLVVDQPANGNTRALESHL
jgi:hypothetical protein